jgi:glycogen debranching enzyme
LVERTVLKENEIYLVSDDNGDIASHNSEGHGLYWRDTRFLSLYELRLAGTKPSLLSSIGEHNFMNNFQFANAAFVARDDVDIAARTISIRRNRFIQDGLYERIGFFNYNPFQVELRVTILVGSDFRDMFEVRGYTTLAVHGTIEPPASDEAGVQLRYVGLDGVRRRTDIFFQPRPSEVSLPNIDPLAQEHARVLPGISGHGDPRQEYTLVPPSALAHFDLALPPKAHRSITVHIVPAIEAGRPETPDGKLSLDDKFVLIRDSYRQWDSECTEIETDHEILNSVIRRARRDLRLLSDRLPEGYLPSAGIPWFSVPFGRDSLITSLQTMILQPSIAYGSLRFLAAHQGQKVDEWRDEEPGKILHEVRLGEAATLGQVPQTPYYGSVDSTPLFLVAFGELLQWTDDLELMRGLKDNVEAALAWIDRFGDQDGDGYVEYASRSPRGIRNQGWKDSWDAVAYPDGRFVEPPIALSEVQGYVYDARQRMASYFRRIGETERAREQQDRAADLKRRFKSDFRLAEQNYYAIALGPDKLQVPVVSSNPGQCLWSGLLDGDEGRMTARRLLQEDMSCGWGVRTLSSQEPMFNPMSYHNGSVWPHDNALIAAGLKRLQLDVEASRLIAEVLEAAMRFPNYRLPELYCGFARDRRYFSMPAQYPVSCSPQAWAAGAVFSMIQTLLGLRADAAQGRLSLRPKLPDWLSRVCVRRLRVGNRLVEFEVVREEKRTPVEIFDSGGLEIVVEPAAEAIGKGRL